MQHLEEGTVHAFLDGALPPSEAHDVEQHVAECAACSAMVAEARGLIAGASRIVSSLDVVRGNVIPKKPAARGGKSLWHSLHLTPARAALAATLMIAVSTLLTVRHDTAEKMVMETRAPDAAPRAPSSVNQAPAPAPAAPSASAISPPPRETPSSVKDRAQAVNEPRKEDDKPIKAAAAPTMQVPPITVSGGAATMDSGQKKVVAKASAAADSVRGANEVSQRQVSANEIAVRNAPRLRALDRIDASSPTTPACFELIPGPITSPKLPQRFALQSLPGDTAQHVVRAVDKDGRLDSVLTGSSWTRATPTEITVRFALNEQTMTLSVRDGSIGVASAAREQRQFAGQAAPSVTRLACRP